MTALFPHGPGQHCEAPNAQRKHAPFIDRCILECLQCDGRINHPNPGTATPTSGCALTHTKPIRPENKNGLAPVRANPLIYVMVGVAGFELATPCTPCKCATRLRYTPKDKIIDAYSIKGQIQSKIRAIF